MEIKSLTGISFDMLFNAFSKAFADYEMQLSKEGLQAMLARRGFDPELSFAAFDGTDIVAFTLNGTGNYNGEPTAYDTGTGTLPLYRGQGLASQIFEYSLPLLKDSGIVQYLLEVLQHNSKAISVYTKLGFKVTREFNYFRQEKSGIDTRLKKCSIDCKLKIISVEELEQAQFFGDFYPSWQNSLESIKRVPDSFVIIGAAVNEQLTGYCVFEPSSGDITQLAVDKELRRKGIASMLLKEILSSYPNDSFKVINTDTSCGSITEFLKSVNIPVVGKQHEMIKRL